MLNVEKEVSQANFDVSVFVNRLTSLAAYDLSSSKAAPGNPFQECLSSSKTTPSNPFQEHLSELPNFNGTSSSTSLDPEKLRSYFEITIQDLQQLKSQYESRVSELHVQAQHEERKHLTECGKLKKSLTENLVEFESIHENMQIVYNKMAALSGQLSDEYIPKNRILEAKELLTDFYRFYNGVTFSWASNREATLIAAEKIQKLVGLSLELPEDPLIKQAKNRIEEVNGALTYALLSDFKEAFDKGDIQSMRACVSTFEKSKRYTLVIDKFVGEYLKNILSMKELQTCILRLASGTEKSVVEAFFQPESVSNRLIQGIFAAPIKNDISKQLEVADKMSHEDYLETLYNNYARLKSLCDEVNRLERCYIDRSQLQKHFKDLFSNYLKGYMSRESRWLTDRFAYHQISFFEALQITKRDLNAGGLSEFRRDIWGVDLTAKETNTILLSQEMTVNMLEETRMAARRCKALSEPESLALNAKSIFDILVQNLIESHLQYGLDIAIYAIPSTAPKNEPSILFLEVVSEANTIFHFFEKAIADCIAPLLSGSVFAREFQEKKAALTKTLETKINTGLERCLTICQSYIQHLLTTEQKRTDFKPESTSIEQSSTVACKKVCRFVSKLRHEIQMRFDGRNVNLLTHEFALRFHRTLVDHFYSFTYNSYGGVTAMMDITEYKEVFHDAANPDPLISQLFHNLYKLINILAMDPRNLKQLFFEYQELGINRDLFMGFVQLRSDFKSEKLANIFK